MKSNIRRFQLVRTEDVSGVSGLGTVAEGVLFKAENTRLKQDPGLEM